MAQKNNQTQIKFNTEKRPSRVFTNAALEPFKLSRSKIDNFIKCARCFYLDRKYGIGEPGGYPFTLNNAVDELLKKEFDIYRKKSVPHPLMEAAGIKAYPFSHENLNKWRENFSGIQYHHKPTNFIVTGAIDDVWVNEAGELHIVDYKATSKATEVNLDAEWQDGYKRQMEMYQWLFRQNGFKVSDVGYFVYANGKRNVERFDAKLEFDIKIIPYKGDDSWVEGTLTKIRETLMSDMPPLNPDCEFCSYRQKAREVELDR